MSSLPKIAIACAAATALLTGHAAADVTVRYDGKALLVKKR